MTSRVRTERSSVSITDFEKELKRLSSESESINMMIYGDANCGKTTIAGTLPGKVLWLVCEPGYKVAARNGAEGISVQISDSAMAWAAIDWLNSRRRYRQFDWICIDGLTTMQDRIRLAYTQEAFDNSEGQPKRARAHRNLSDKPDYFNTQNFLKTWIGTLVDLPVNLLVTAHAYRTNATEDGELMVFPGIQGKVNETSNAITGLMDVTGYMEKKRIRVKLRDGGYKRSQKYRLWFESPERTAKEDDDVRYICGDKFNALGRYIDSPQMPDILARIRGEAA